MGSRLCGADMAATTEAEKLGWIGSNVKLQLKAVLVTKSFQVHFQVQCRNFIISKTAYSAQESTL